jgi:hypothetical protein
VVWVAKSTVNSGNWARATDVLYSLVYRTAALNLPTSSGVFIWDSVTKDPYGIYSASTGFFTVPVTGLYRVTAEVGFSATAANQTVTLYLANQTAAYNQRTTGSTGSGSTFATMSGLVNMTAGDTFRLNAVASASLAVVVPAFGITSTTMSFMYEGTG